MAVRVKEMIRLLKFKSINIRIIDIQDQQVMDNSYQIGSSRGSIIHSPIQQEWTITNLVRAYSQQRKGNNCALKLSKEFMVTARKDRLQRQNQVPEQIQTKELLEEDTNCTICYKTAINASICRTEQCQKVFCARCVEKLKDNQRKCPFCRSSPFFVKKSPYRLRINTIQKQCGYCKKYFKLEGLILHYRNQCIFNKINCKICKQFIPKDLVIQHTISKHQDQFKDIVKMLYNGTQEFDYNKVKAKNKQYLEAIEKNPHLGSNGKFYCGGQLQTQCMCCDGNCGPTNGQNCRDCMKLDIQRFGLKKGQFINSQGNVCWRAANQDNFSCGTSSYSDPCRKQRPCYSCQRMKQNYSRYQHIN